MSVTAFIRFMRASVAKAPFQFTPHDKVLIGLREWQERNPSDCNDSDFLLALYYIDCENLSLRQQISDLNLELAKARRG